MHSLNRRTALQGLALASAGVFAPAVLAQTKKYRIGASSFGAAAEYMAKWAGEIRQHPAVKSGLVSLTVFDGKFDPLVQSNQVDTMITQRFDAIVIAPMDFSAGGAAVDRAVDAGIPVVGSVTRAKSDKLSAYIGTDDVEGGRMITRAMADKLGGKGNLVILEGPIGQSPQLLRRQGIDEALKSTPGLKLLASQSANWNRAEGQKITENWLLAHAGKINGVLAENDEMGLGAIEALKSAGMKPGAIPVIAIDGIADGVRAVRDGQMLTTLYKDAHMEGQGALDLALRALMGADYKPQSDIWSGAMKWDASAKLFVVPWKPITAANVQQFA
jgi:putative xylitol transport system substrate-binding protein